MSREMFLEIIDKQLFIALFFIILAYVTSWFVFFNLGLMTLDVKDVKLSKIFLLALAGSAYSFWVKQLFPWPLVGFTIPLFVALLLWISARGLPPLKYFWSAMTVTVTSFAGDIIIQAPLCAVSPKIAYFLFRSAWGYVAGTAAETFFPALALILLPQISPKLKNPLIPPFGPKPDRIDLYASLTYFGMFFMFYIASIAFYINMIKGLPNSFLFLISIWVTGFIMIFGHIQNVKVLTKKFEFENGTLKAEKTRLETEKQQIEMDRARLEKEKLSLEQDKYRLEDEKRKLEYEKGKLEIEKGKLEIEKVKLEIEKNQVIGEKGQLEKEKTELAKDLQDLIATNEEGAKLHKVKKAAKDFIYKVMHIENSEEEHNIDLTDRELSVIDLVQQGKNPKEMAAILKITEGSVRNVITGLHRKLKVSDKAQLALYVSNLVKNK